VLTRVSKGAHSHFDIVNRLNLASKVFIIYYRWRVSKPTGVKRMIITMFTVITMASIMTFLEAFPAPLVMFEITI